MPLVILLRGVNVGGHRTFRPSVLARQLQHLGAVNVGAAGTFVIRQSVARAQLRAEIARRLPFEAEIVICDGRAVARLLTHEAWGAAESGPGIVQFVSVLAAAPRTVPALPHALPPSGRWLVQLLAREQRFVLGRYRREMPAIANLGKVDALFGVPATTRNLNTIRAIARVVEQVGR